MFDADSGTFWLYTDRSDLYLGIIYIITDLLFNYVEFRCHALDLRHTN